MCQVKRLVKGLVRERLDVEIAMSLSWATDRKNKGRRSSWRLETNSKNSVSHDTLEALTVSCVAFRRLLSFVSKFSSVPAVVRVFFLSVLRSESEIGSLRLLPHPAQTSLLASTQSTMQKPVVIGWNKPTNEYYEVPKARQRKPLSRSTLYGACVITLALLCGWQEYVTQTPALAQFVCPL